MAKNKINTKINFDTKDFDPFGAKPAGKAIGSAIDQATIISFKALEGFLTVICKPLVEELGLLCQDRISAYRLRNIISVLKKHKEDCNLMEKN